MLLFSITLCHVNPQIDHFSGVGQPYLFSWSSFSACFFCEWEMVLCACCKGQNHFTIHTLQAVSRVLKWNTCLLFLEISDTELECFLRRSGALPVTVCRLCSSGTSHSSILFFFFFLLCQSRDCRKENFTLLWWSQSGEIEFPVNRSFSSISQVFSHQNRSSPVAWRFPT